MPPRCEPSAEPGHGVGSADRSRGGHGERRGAGRERKLHHGLQPDRGNGNVAPLRIISGPATGLLNPSGLAVDTVNNEILVANIGSITADSSSITVYSRTANGDAAPLRTISGAATGLAQPIGLAVDTVNNEVLVATMKPQLHHGLQPDGGSATSCRCEPSAGHWPELQSPARSRHRRREQRGAGGELAGRTDGQRRHGLQPDGERQCSTAACHHRASDRAERASIPGRRRHVSIRVRLRFQCQCVLALFPRSRAGRRDHRRPGSWGHGAHFPEREGQLREHAEHLADRVRRHAREPGRGAPSAPRRSAPTC